MATYMFHKFGDFPSELRLEIWRLYLEDEAQSRQVVIWDGRVMPFRHLSSPLLKVNIETRTVALRFYPVKVNMYLLPENEDFFVPLSATRLDQLVAEDRDSEDGVLGSYSRDNMVVPGLSQRRPMTCLRVCR